ncbi:hypothetical protein LUZ61_000471 [Rhynchospora tenuis]|uniref:Uncharacterized protein n=1 Tax=Rhynchospora tenuis TaxID=198213 RepID=A0AAD5ZF36_9POAL|nr:hypothetical protein LUZ61_000471 [Rhynchospora tenuis]
MPLKELATDGIGVATISLVCLLSLLCLFCIYRSICFHFWIHRRRRRDGFLHLYSYFTGPSICRLVLLLLSIYWGLGEILRLSFLGNPKYGILSDDSWRGKICKFYVISNLGFAEPGMFLMLGFLLHAALQRSEFGSLSPRWNRNTIGCVVLCCLPAVVWDVAVLFIAPQNGTLAQNKFFIESSSRGNSTGTMVDADVTCTYPLLSTIFLAAFYVILMIYVTYLGTRVLVLVINKGLRRRIYILVFSVVIFLPLRVTLLGLLVLLKPELLAYEVVVFVSFVLVLCCSGVGIVILVYFPVADMLVLRDPEHLELMRTQSDDSN